MGKHSEEFVEAGEATELMKTDVGSKDGKEREGLTFLGWQLGRRAAIMPGWVKSDDDRGGVAGLEREGT